MNYYIGMDIGTDSIGWAVTNEDYTVPKFKGNAMWGIRLLDEANTAVERRAFRSARRRLERRKFRQKCLENLFDVEISKVDVAFFQRLKESSFYDGDKNVEGNYSIFNDDDFTDKDYYKKYPTIYHLRKALIEDSCDDIRLLYLAVSHIVKNRGHFLFDADLGSNDGVSDFNAIWNELNLYISDNILEEDVSSGLVCDDIRSLQSVLKSSNLTKTAKKEILMKLMGLTKKSSKMLLAVIGLLCGCSVKSAELFGNEALKESEAKSVCFSSGYEDNLPVYESAFGENFEFLEKIKAVYDWSILAEILNGEKYISFAKVNIYEKHKADLLHLKKFVKTYIPQKYNAVFNDNTSGVCNYLAYSGHSKKTAVEKKCNQSEFCEFLLKVLPKECPDDQYADMYNSILAGSFMPKIVSTDNGVIPMQINRMELEKILNNAKQKFAFLNDADEVGITVAEKILCIFNYRIPYYIGPLNKHSKNSWIVREKGEIYPWNFESIVDTEKSAEKFIENLTSKCTYLYDKDVLPKNSLLYSAFMVLNELNNLRLDDEKIPVALKQKIFLELFMRENKVTQTKLRKYLSCVGYCDAKISGIDSDFKASLKPFIDLKNLNLSDSEKEGVVKAVTIFGNDKKMLKKRLIALFADKLSENEIKYLCKLKYSDWGRLSKELLLNIQAPAFETGEMRSIIRMMWETNENFMQVLSQKYTYAKSIENENARGGFKSLKEEVEALYISPKVKRPVYQSMQIIEEIVKIQGEAPRKIFIEMARGAEEKKRTASRKTKLLELYKLCKKEEPQLFEELSSKDDEEFRRDALYLYFTQMGKCMYTGEPIDINRLYDRNVYDIDHIFPRSKVKDDSLDNRVLVLKKSNEEKSNVYPINENIRKNRKAFWALLCEKGFISKKKYERLVRNTPLEDSELADFISRQLVETRQSTKAVAELLKKRYPKTEIVYVKARLVSEFRDENNFVKCRDVNDYHHAKDAYLNIVVGNVYNVRYTHNKANFISGVQRGDISLNRMFTYTTKGAWITENNESLITVRKMMGKNNIRFTRYSVEQHGGLFKQNPKKKNIGSVPLKQNSVLSDTSKYGGYDKPISKYFVLIEYTDRKGKRIRSFEPVDAYLEPAFLKDPVGFMADKVGSDRVEIIIPKIKYNTLISIDGFRMHISNKMNNGAVLGCKPAVQLVLGEDSEVYIKRISNYLSKCTELRREKTVTESDKITAAENIKLYVHIKERIHSGVLDIKFNNIYKTMSEGEDVFKKMSLYKQCYVLMEVLHILHCNVLTGDLVDIGASKKTGTVTISNKLPTKDKVKSFKIIHQSITGLFEKEIDVLI